jgi:molybdate transport system permease protein
MTKLREFSRQFFGEGYPKWIFLLPSLILLAFFALPLAALIFRSISPDFFTNALSRQAFLALRLSLITSSITTLIAVLLGTPLAYLLAHWKIKRKDWLELILDLPIVLPPSVAGLALLIAFGRRGLFGSVLNIFGISLPFTTAAVVMAQMFIAAPLYVRSARIGFSHIDKQLEESAYVEGANRWQMFYEVMIPLAMRALASGAILTWTRALGEFGATILFAGNLEGVTQTMPIAIYLGFERNLGVALALAVVLIFVSVILLMITKKLEKTEE